jgi:hypothetical protein
MLSFFLTVNLHISNNDIAFDFEYAPIENDNGNIFIDILINPNDKANSQYFEADFNNAVLSNKSLRTRTNKFSDLKSIISTLDLNDNKIPTTKLEAFSIIIEGVNSIKKSLYSNSHLLDLNNRMMLASEHGSTKLTNALFDQVQPLLHKAFLKLNIPFITKILS